MNSAAKPPVLCLCLLLFALEGALHARQSTPRGQGRWEGAIETPGQALGVIVDLAPTPAGVWAGKISVPVQGLSDFILSNVKVTGDRASFSMEGVPGAPQFIGKLSKDGRQLYGTFSQGGGRVPFKLERTGDVDPATGRGPKAATAAHPRGAGRGPGRDLVRSPGDRTDQFAAALQDRPGRGGRLQRDARQPGSRGDGAETFADTVQGQCRSAQVRQTARILSRNPQPGRVRDRGPLEAVRSDHSSDHQTSGEGSRIGSPAGLEAA